MVHDENFIRDVIKKAGGPQKVGLACGVSRQAVSQWVHNGISKECVEILAEMTGISEKILRPSRRRARVQDNQAA